MPSAASTYLQGIDNAEIIETVHSRRAPMIPVGRQLGDPELLRGFGDPPAAAEPFAVCAPATP
jgi:hypothetical protein